MLFELALAVSVFYQRISKGELYLDVNVNVSTAELATGRISNPDR